jgi:hypothetical protein
MATSAQHGQTDTVHASPGPASTVDMKRQGVRLVSTTLRELPRRRRRGDREIEPSGSREETDDRER